MRIAKHSAGRARHKRETRHAPPRPSTITSAADRQNFVCRFDEPIFLPPPPDLRVPCPPSHRAATRPRRQVCPRPYARFALTTAGSLRGDESVTTDFPA